MSDFGVGALGGVVLIDPATGLPYRAMSTQELDARVPTPPSVGTYFLHSEDGVVTWITPAELMDILNI